MNLEELEKIAEVAVGEKNFALLSKLGIDEEFAGIGQKFLNLYDMALESMGNGNLEPKRLLEINEYFDNVSRELVSKVTFGKDQHGIRVTMEQLFGEIKSVRPEYMPYKLAMVMSFWIMERKLRLHYEEQAGNKVKYEAVRIAGV